MERAGVAMAWVLMLGGLVLTVPALPRWAGFLLGMLAGAIVVWQFGLWAYERTKADTVRDFPRRTDNGKEA
jgi:hypothetical protein